MPGHHVTLGFGSLRDRCAEQGYCTGVEFVVGVGFVGLEARREFVGVLQDLVNSARHGHHLRNFSRALIAWTMTWTWSPST